MNDMFKARYEGLSRRAKRALRQRYDESRMVTQEQSQLDQQQQQQTGVRYGSDFVSDTNRKPSGTIWRDCPWPQINNGFVDGITFWDDFVDFGKLPFVPTNTSVQTTAGGLGRYEVFSGAGAGVWAPDAMPHSSTPLGTGGIISNLVADGSAGVIGTASSPFSLVTTQSGKLWFEARIAYTSILTNAGQIFVGLGETAVTTYSVTIPLGNADVTSNAIAMVGFNRLEDGLSVLNTSYADHATSWTDIKASASSGVLAANTWIKLGMKFDFSQTTTFGTFYVNGVDTGTYLTKAACLALTHLDAKGLGPLLAVYGDSEGSDYIYMDWWRAAQSYEAG